MESILQMIVRAQALVQLLVRELNALMGPGLVLVVVIVVIILVMEHVKNVEMSIIARIAIIHVMMEELINALI